MNSKENKGTTTILCQHPDCQLPIVPCPTTQCPQGHGYVHAHNQQHYCAKEETWEVQRALPPAKYQRRSPSDPVRV